MSRKAVSIIILCIMLFSNIPLNNIGVDSSKATGAEI